MKNIQHYIESGILETYVLGLATAEETLEVEQLALNHLGIKRELEKIRENLESYTQQSAVNPPLTLKPMLLAIIDYSERMKAGEKKSNPSVINEKSTISDFNEWLNRADMTLASSFEGIFVKLIDYTPQMTTAIVWIKEMAPEEVHHDEYEKFLIVEGTCDIVVEGEVKHFVSGDYFAIPLHKNHHVKVTSAIPCKVILQRIAA